MRGTTAHRGWLGAGALALVLATMGACGDDSSCNHVLHDVARFEDCTAMAAARNCSNLVVYSNKNKRCLVQDCGDCNGPIPTATAVPSTPGTPVPTVVPTAVP